MRIPLISEGDNLLGRWETLGGAIAVIETGPISNSRGEVWSGYVIGKGGYQYGAKWYPDGRCYYSEYGLRKRVVVSEA